MLLSVLSAGDAAVAQTAPANIRVVWQIGEADRPNYDLSTISGIAVAGDGRVYVGQSQELSVRVFDSGGRFIHKFGRQGNGPGELQSVSAVQIRGDRIHITDVSRQVLLSFTLGGAFREQWGLHNFPAQPGTISGPHQRLSNGYFDVTGVRDDTARITIMLPGQAEKRQLTLLRVEGTALLLRTARVSMTIRRPVQWGAMYVADPSGSTITIVDQALPRARDHEAAFAVVQLTADGDTVYRKAFRYPVRRFTVDEWNELLLRGVGGAMEMLTQARRTHPTGRGLPVTEAEIREGLWALYQSPLPQPPVDQMRVADDRSVWLRQTSPAENGHRIWLVLDGSGAIKSRVRVPEAWRIEAIAQNHIYAAAKDAFDIPLVIKARIAAE